MWVALDYNNLLTCVTTATNLLDFMTTKIIFYMESAIANFEVDIHNKVLVNFLHSYSNALNYLTFFRIHLQIMHQVFSVFLE
jgi:hypothetical protein